MAFLPPIKTTGIGLTAQDRQRLDDATPDASNSTIMLRDEDGTVSARFVLRTLTSLNDAGIAGELAFFNAKFYGYTGTQWRSLVPTFADLMVD